ncbi:MAG: DUF86 domain-containing protein [Caldilineaceae bacterium SB0665_bin_25]|nr:DUF86 domain-containing protein [Caldilineaceae bacterium SB0665_bin_25]
MRLEVKKYLYDIRSAADLLAEFLAGKTFADYQRDAMLRAAVERQLAIIGEAVSQLARRDEELAARITNYRRVIAFRNILIHGYSAVDDGLVWDVVETNLPLLRHEVERLISDE